ncbi:hemerythrin domain-containing protein [Allohahella marinimesophila]|uniref:Hemerythrin-like domain-containing protein n=1 Tax=Allohahella marinimesophila TaxID=1054972 RepID=A0ABP7PYJ4_9GAMM
MADDIFQAVIKDHATIRVLMKAVDDCGKDADLRREAFANLAKALIAHAKAEERSLYDTMLGESPSHDESLHIAEHDAISELIHTLGGKREAPTDWPATFLQLKTLVKRHLDEEENELFPVGQHLLTADQKIRLGELYRAAKADEDSKDRSDILVL